MRVTAMLFCQEARIPRDFSRQGADLLQVAEVGTIAPLPAPWNRQIYLEFHRTEPNDPNRGVIEIQDPRGRVFQSPQQPTWSWDGQAEKVGLTSTVGLTYDLRNFLLTDYGVHWVRFYAGNPRELLMEAPFVLLSPDDRIHREQGQHSPPLEDEAIHPKDELGRVIRRNDPDM